MGRAFALLVLTTLVAVAPSHATHVDEGDIRWACGFGGGHPSQCGIDPIGGDDAVDSLGDPDFEPAGAGDWIPDDARVLGIVHNGDARAYPVRMLNSHEIVNDVVGGEKLSVTFCPLCGSGVTFLREFTYEGTRIETNFTASGYLYSTDMVMWDPVTNQLWNQITGSSIGWLDENRPATDAHSDHQLELLPTTVTTWASWRAQHPATLLLQPHFAPSNYRENAYAVTQPDNCDHGLSGERDCDVEGLHPKEQMVAFDDGEGGVAFPIRWVAAEPGGNATFTTTEGRTFTAVADSGGGAQIFEAGDIVASTHMFWFAWHDHAPDTEVWLPEEADATTGGDEEPNRLPLRIIITAIVGVLVLVFILQSARKQL